MKSHGIHVWIFLPTLGDKNGHIQWELYVNIPIPWDPVGMLNFQRGIPTRCWNMFIPWSLRAGVFYIFCSVKCWGPSVYLPD